MIVYMQMIDTPEDKHKFEVLYLEYRGLMFYIANQILNNEQDAEDAVHTAFIAIAENIQKIENPVCPKTKGYVVTIVENKAIDLYRRKQRYQKVSLDEATTGMAIAYDDSHTIARCFSLLPSQDKHILMLKYRYGYDNREIAKILSITQDAAIKRIQRSKQKLEELCAKEEVL